MNKQQRVQFGKQVEDIIYQQLQYAGMTLTKATAKQDMYDKVDAIIQHADGTKDNLQIKYKTPDGNDSILFEVVWLQDYNGNDRVINSSADYDGRDFIGQSDIYAVLSKDGQHIRLCDVQKLKMAADKMTQQLLKSDNNQYIDPSIGKVYIKKDFGDSNHAGIVYYKVLFNGNPEYFVYQTIDIGYSIWKA